MLCLGRVIVLSFSLMLGFAGISRAQWQGVGAGGSGNDLGNTANWSGGTINGNFSSITTSATIVADASGSLSFSTPLNFNFASSGVNLTVGNSTVSPNDTINFSQTTGDIVDISAQPNTVLTFGSDLTFSLASSSSVRYLLNYVPSTTLQVTPLTTTTTPIAIFKSQITGSTTGTLALENYTQYGVSGVTAESGEATMVMTNANSNFTAGLLQSGGYLGFTSLANTGTASSLGSSGALGFTNGGALVYVGTGNQTSNRVISVGGSSSTMELVNDSASASTLTLNFNGAYYGSGAQQLKVFTAGSNVIDLTGVIADGNGGTTGTGIVSLNKTSTGTINTLTVYTGQGSPTISSSGNGGTLVLAGASTYSGGTTIASGILLAENTTGSATGSGTVALSGTSTTLGGFGTVSGAVTAAANTIIAPGVIAGSSGTTATGTLTLNGGLSAASTLQLSLNVNGTSSTSVLALGSSTLTLGNNTINLTFNDLGNGTMVANTFYTVMTGNGTWSNATTITASSLPSGFSGFSYNYTNTGGTDSLQVEFSAVPEPSAWALLAAGFGALLFLQRRGRQSRCT